MFNELSRTMEGVLHREAAILETSGIMRKATSDLLLTLIPTYSGFIIISFFRGWIKGQSVW